MQPETPPRDRDAKRLLPSIPMRPPAPPTHGVHARYGACQCVELGVVFLLGLRRERIRRPEQVLQIPCANPNDHDPQPFCQVTYVRKTGLVEGEPKNHTSKALAAGMRFEAAANLLEDGALRWPANGVRWLERLNDMTDVCAAAARATQRTK